tara:strand:- start:385 stop:495 length:111 start_codon:yes stop_codon:yes gene_type:complete
MHSCEEKKKTVLIFADLYGKNLLEKYTVIFISWVYG